MWNCSAVLTKNGSLCNRTFNFTTKDSCTQRCITLTLKKRLFKTYVLPIEKDLNAEKFTKYNLNCILRASSTQQLNYIKSSQTLSKYLSIRAFHTCFPLKSNTDINDTIQSKQSNSRRINTNINFDDLLKEDNPTITENEHNDSTWSTDRRHIKPQKFSLKDIERMYPNPKSKLHNIYQTVKSMAKRDQLSFDYTQAHNVWHCTVKIEWPEVMSFTAKSGNKVGAGNMASHKCLHWLELNKRLNKGMPILYTTNDVNNMTKRPVNLSIKEETLNAAKIILDKYEENIQSIIESHDNTLHIDRNRFQDGAILDPVGKSNPSNRYPEKLDHRNALLKSRYEHRKSTAIPIDLPINEFREEIVREIERNNVVVIKGDTGCGKTTQVPQFIMDAFAECGRATDCNMIVAQPRRISAISLAERIADERQEQVGDVVGYQVRLSQELPNTPAGILFCTTGILLRKMQFNPTLEGCSHVIIDEAHERTINTDMLLVLLKRAIEQKPTLKIIIMSATINAELFQNYFNCNVIEVPGRAFPVEMNFLEDIDKLGLRSPSRWDLSFEDPEKEKNGPYTDIVKMGELISWITRSKPPGAVLCFLPGWSEIVKMKQYLEDYSFLPKNQVMIVPVHSKMPHYDQRKIFSRPPQHVRKIVLATDIAETGITVADVVYVVDSCTHRQVQWHEKRGFTSIDNEWASQANINQRKGRAGRVKPGISYHFVTRSKFEQLDRYPLPEIMRSSLEKTVLDAKTYSNEKALNFLGAMPQPPAPSVIYQAVQDLINLGALDNNENLTPLGKRIALFTLNPQLSKAIVYSAIFQCLSPMITITSIMSGENEIFTGVLHDKSSIRHVKSAFHPTSDHISLAWLFQQWYTINRNSRTDSREFAFKSKLVPEKMLTLCKIREINAEHLLHAQMLPNLHTIDNMSAKENEYAELDELCRGILLSGIDQVLYQRDFDIRKGQLKKGVHTFIMENGHRATITPDSVNFKRTQWPSPFMTYVRRTHNEERRTSLIRETSVISPITVFLFSQAQILGYKYNNTSDTQENDVNNNNDESQILFKIGDRENVKLLCRKETADVLLDFRDAMWGVVRYLVANYGVVKPDHMTDFEQVETFKMEMLQVLGKMLSEASEFIDNPEPYNNKKIHINNDKEHI